MDELRDLIARQANADAARLSGDEFVSAFGAAVTRITSYNVCYTKLLRVLWCRRPGPWKYTTGQVVDVPAVCPLVVA